MWKRWFLAGLSVAFTAGTWYAYRGADHAMEPADAAVMHGFAIWQASNCVSCHQLYGLGGYMGPDLTNAHGDKGETRIRTFVRYGTGRMPAHAMSDADLDALVAFLRWADRSGRSRVPQEAVHWTGTYHFEEP